MRRLADSAVRKMEERTILKMLDGYMPPQDFLRQPLQPPVYDFPLPGSGCDFKVVAYYPVCPTYSLLKSVG